MSANKHLPRVSTRRREVYEKISTFRISEGFQKQPSASMSWLSNREVLTLPYAGPENISIIDIHHYPLTIERILINRSEVVRSEMLIDWGREDSHITTRIVAGDVPPLCYMVVRTSVWTETWARPRRQCLDSVLGEDVSVEHTAALGVYRRLLVACQ